ncbi:hypothetical protein PROFUN_10738 [Planoprotostelium fungivorum]|uniref:Protein-lysine N-methyltransferase PROFUN_10738 n=1 Tax=Planoprotostelium fungivorum TaxID=1890364 RepID=A0A2P6N7Y0_9EUKA|nr:hypothetical protein PROFUN_10738 [Planoprotostelium fungivorum]
MSDNEGEFQPSKLGTREHWDDAYENELKNYDDNGDIGEIWFGEDCLRRVVTFVTKLPLDLNSPILDLGTGNGATLFKLAKKGFSSLLGVDYSAPSILLAKKIEETKKRGVIFEEDDILNTKLNSKFKLILDKGTYDAISLSDEKLNHQAAYRKSVIHLLEDTTSFFVITSCNYNKEELLSMFDSEFKYHSEIKYSTIKFGGQEGSTVTTLCFQKK